MKRQQHPYAEILVAIAEGHAIQYRYNVYKAKQSWTDCVNAEDAMQRVLNASRQMLDHDEYVFRIKPDMIEINGHQIQAPIRELPTSANKIVWWPSFGPDSTNLTESAGIGYYPDLAKNLLEDGLLHLSEEAASAHAKALRSFTKVQK